MSLLSGMDEWGVTGWVNYGRVNRQGQKESESTGAK